MSKEQPVASILVVDDDPEIVAMLSTRLAHRGYKVSTASDGHRALELAKRERPDLVLLDVMMPGKSGRVTLISMSSCGDRSPRI